MYTQVCHVCKFTPLGRNAGFLDEWSAAGRRWGEEGVGTGPTNRSAL